MTFKPSYLALAVAISSQAIADSANTELDQVKVYGQKQVKSLQDTTASVGLVTSEDMEDSTIQDINDVFSRVANVSSVSGGNESVFAIRGVSIYGVSDDPVDYTAAVYVDEVAQSIDSIRWGAMGLWDVEQVEVYRGPQGTLQGRNSLIGAIHLKTVDPTFDYTGKAQASTGAFNTHRLSAAGGGGIAASDFAIRVSADKYQSDGYIENETRGEDDYAGFDRSTYRAKMLYQPKAFSNLSAMFTVSRNESNIGDQPYASSEDPFKREAISDVETKNDTITDSASLKISLGLAEGLELTSVSSVSSSEFDRLDDWDSSDADGGYINQLNESESVSQEIRLSFDKGTFNGVTGVYYSKNKDDRAWDLEGNIPKSSVQQQAFQAMMAPTELGGFGLDQTTAQGIWDTIGDNVSVVDVYNGGYETENIAVFTDVNWLVTQQLTFTAGVRYDSEEQDRDNSNVRSASATLVEGSPYALHAIKLLDGLAALGTSQEAVNTDYEALLPKVGVNYAITETLSTGFTIQQGYRSGGSSISLLSGEAVDFDPEFTTNYELSLRSQFMNGAITANANVFYTDWEDQQVDYSPSGDSRDTVIANAGESNLWGGELELNAYLTSSVQVFSSLGYVETEFEDFTATDSNGDLINYEGNQFPDAPKYNASVGSIYRGFNGVFASVDANYRSQSFTDVENNQDLKVDARTLVNAKVGYEQVDWSAYLWVTNLTDREYLTNVRQPNSLVEDARVVGAPRMLGATFAAAF